MEKTGGLRRNTELFLLFVGAIPVFLLYAMYMVTARSTLTIETMAVPIGLFAAFTIAHIAIRFLAPAAYPAILPICQQRVVSGYQRNYRRRLSRYTNYYCWLQHVVSC